MVHPLVESDIDSHFRGRTALQCYQLRDAVARFGNYLKKNFKDPFSDLHKKKKKSLATNQATCSEYINDGLELDTGLHLTSQLLV